MFLPGKQVFKDRRSLEVVYWYELLSVLINITSLIKTTYSINPLARFKLISLKSKTSLS